MIASATIAADAEVGPYAIIGKQVSIGSGTVVGSHAVIGDRITIGANNQIFHHTSVGVAPQDLKYHGEETWTHIGGQ